MHVDELMREELKNLKLVTTLNWRIAILTLYTNIQAVDRDKGTKKKKGKKKGKKVSEDSTKELIQYILCCVQKKGKKGKKGKKEKDLTPDR